MWEKCYGTQQNLTDDGLLTDSIAVRGCPFPTGKFMFRQCLINYLI